jgi:hypothetical protein
VTADSAWTTKLATESHFHGKSVNTQFTNRRPLKISESCGQTNIQKRKLNISVPFSKPHERLYKNRIEWCWGSSPSGLDAPRP